MCRNERIGEKKMPETQIICEGVKEQERKNAGRGKQNRLRRGKWKGITEQEKQKKRKQEKTKKNLKILNRKKK